MHIALPNKSEHKGIELLERQLVIYSKLFLYVILRLIQLAYQIQPLFQIRNAWLALYMCIKDVTEDITGVEEAATASKVC